MSPYREKEQMTESQRLTVRASEIRQRLNEIAGLEGDALTNEVGAESDKLGTEYRDVETRLRAAVIAESEGQPETRDTPEDAEIREGRIPDFPVTRSHPPASWPSAANSSICRTYRKTAGEESRRRSPVANRWMRP